ncbi:MAG: DUF2283 domain-containing protein [candidate division Zixibacteria bacterium]|nr:DUF2283 domain-containing protein [Candidatus Tariuqbacter arcticus]
MKITYDPEADVLYIQLTSKMPVESVNIEPGVFYEIDDEDHLVSIEILDASERYKDFNQVEFIHYPLPIKKRPKKQSKKKEAASA